MEDQLFALIYQIIHQMPQARRRSGQRFSDASVALIIVWAALRDRPISWACQRPNAPRRWGCAQLPTGTTISRRSRTPQIKALLDQAYRQSVGVMQVGLVMLYILDSKPRIVGVYSKDKNAKWGQVGKTKARGYRLHLASDLDRRACAWTIASMNQADSTVARELIPQLPGEGYALADAAFDSNPLCQCAAAHGLRLLAPRRKPGTGLSENHPQHDSRRQSVALLESPHGTISAFGRELYAQRATIEQTFAQWTNQPGGLTTGLPNWVRTPHRVTMWVAAKLLIHGVRTSKTKNLRA